MWTFESEKKVESTLIAFWVNWDDLFLFFVLFMKFAKFPFLEDVRRGFFHEPKLQMLQHEMTRICDPQVAWGSGKLGDSGWPFR